MPLLDVRDLSVQYRTRRGPAHALDGVSLSIAPGEVLAIVGESGCGKTTMALALMGLLPDTATVSGQMLLDDRDISHLRPDEWRRIRGRDVAMVFQGAMNAWNPVYPVGDQIVEAILAHEPDLRLSAARERVAELFAAVGLSPDRCDDYPHQYSGGMKQRAVIAMALACGPKLLIADEPTTALDVIVQDRILRELRRIQRERRVGMLYISHDMAVVAELADVVAVMYAGQIVEMGPTGALYEWPSHPYTAALLAASPSLRGPRRAPRGLAGGPPSLVDPPPGCRFSARCSRASERCATESPALALHRDGLLAACWHPIPAVTETVVFAPDAGAPSRVSAPPPASADSRLGLEGVQKIFSVGGGLFGRGRQRVCAVNDVSLEIAAGESVGLVGESGSGKTTVGRMIVRLDDPTYGSIRVRLDQTWAAIPDVDRGAFRRGVQMIFQDPYASLNPRMTIGDVVSEPLDVLGIGGAEERMARVVRMLERVGLTPAAAYVHRYPHELSGGQRQRVAIARAMVVEPALVVADEPTSMLDVSVRAGIIELLLDLKRGSGVSYLYITHDLAVARHICDRLAVMYQGRLVELGDTEDVLQHPLHPYTRALVAAVPVPDPSYRRPEPVILRRTSPLVEAGARCRFLDRCPLAADRCVTDGQPSLVEITPGHAAACYETGRPSHDPGHSMRRGMPGETYR